METASKNKQNKGSRAYIDITFHIFAFCTDLQIREGKVTPTLTDCLIFVIEAQTGS